VRCFVYILGSSGKGGYRTYVGWTNDLERRLARHNAGTGARSTRGRLWVVLYAEWYASREQAMSREWHLKRDRTFRRRLIQETLMSRSSTRTRKGRLSPKIGRRLAGAHV
jgi:putative endonuclease